MKSAAVILAGALLFTACGGSDVAGPSGDANNPPSGDNALVDPNKGFAAGTPVDDYSSLVAYLRSTKALVLTPGPVTQAYLSVEGHVVDIDGEWVQVYEYATPEEAEREAKASPPSGVPDGMMTLVAVTPPTLHLNGKILVLSTNPSQTLRATLDAVLGKPMRDPRDNTAEGGATGSEPARAFTFAGLAHGTAYAGAPERPVVLHVTTAAEASVLAGLVDDPDLAQTLKAFDPAGGALVAVFYGVVPSAGYDLRIEGVDADGASVRVQVALSVPDGPVAQVLTYPYDIIRITDESALPESALWSVVTADGKTLVEVRDPRRQPADGATLVDPADPGHSGTEITDGYTLDGGTPGIVIDVDSPDGTNAGGGTEVTDGYTLDGGTPGIVIDIVIDAEPSGGAGGGALPIGDTPDSIDRPGILGPPIPDPEPDGPTIFRVKGTVRTVSRDKAGIPVSFLIDAGPGSLYDAAVVAITGTTRILASDGRALGPEAITEGTALLVVSQGPVRESYPVQFDAVEILVALP